MSDEPALHLFEGFGIELEYMLVDARSLDVRPVTDELLRSFAGAYVSDVELDSIALSNELVLHVLELKTNGPAPALAGWPARFQRAVSEVNRHLAPLDARLMPTAMHPWMDPLEETRLWPHDASPIYAAFDRIFSCRGHGWSNLQSMHINLPFADDQEFGRLHAAIRLLLPIMPALAASSPVVAGQTTGLLDNRLEFYRWNARRVPSVTGRVIPERAYSQEAYRQTILEPIYADLAPLDPEGLLRHEWANARGAIARFERNTIEIRVLDVQECPLADLAVAALIVAALHAMTRETWADLATQQAWPEGRLHEFLMATIRDGERARLTDRAYLSLFGMDATSPCTAGELWQSVAAALLHDQAEWRAPLRVILEHGPLARRILSRTGPQPTRARLAEVYGELCACLATGQLFTAR